MEQITKIIGDFGYRSMPTGHLAEGMRARGLEVLPSNERRAHHGALDDILVGCVGWERSDSEDLSAYGRWRQ